MTRLTNEARVKIRRMIIAHKFDPIYRQFDRERNELGREVYDYEYGLDETGSNRLGDRVVALQVATSGAAFATRNSFTANAGGWKVALTLGEDRAFLSKHHHNERYTGDPMFSYDAGSQLGKRLQDYAQRRKAAQDEEKHLEEQVDGQLRAHFTFDKLSAAWPEIDRFVRAVERGLPAPASSISLANHDALNTALDLPPETQADD